MDKHSLAVVTSFGARSMPGFVGVALDKGRGAGEGEECSLSVVNSILC